MIKLPFFYMVTALCRVHEATCSGTAHNGAIEFKTHTIRIHSMSLQGSAPGLRSQPSLKQADQSAGSISITSATSGRRATAAASDYRTAVVGWAARRGPGPAPAGTQMSDSDGGLGHETRERARAGGGPDACGLWPGRGLVTVTTRTLSKCLWGFISL